MLLSAVNPVPFDWTVFWTGMGSFVLTFQTPLTILAILVGAVLTRIALHFVVRRVVARVVSGVKKRQRVENTDSLLTSPLAAIRIVQRTRTLGSVLNNIVTVVIVIVALLLIVTAIDANIIGSFALITAALGAGLGFGAQNIVKDVLNGLFMVAEDQLGVGDQVDLGPATGVVESVGIRITQIRSADGTVWFVRNGEILRVGNFSQGWANTSVDVSVPYGADIDVVREAMLGAAADMWNSPTARGRLVEKPDQWGIESITADAVVVRLTARTRTSSREDVARELRLRIKRALDARGIGMPGTEPADPSESVPAVGASARPAPVAAQDSLAGASAGSASRPAQGTRRERAE